MSRADDARNAAILEDRRRNASLRAIAGRFGLSVTRVVQLVNEGRVDPVFEARRADLSERELRRYRSRLEERIASDMRRLAIVEEELEVRRIDRLAGVG